MHHFRAPWASVEESRSISPLGYNTNNSNHNRNPTIPAPSTAKGEGAPAVTRPLRYSPSATPYTTNNINIPTEVVSPGYKRPDCMDGRSNSSNSRATVGPLSGRAGGGGGSGHYYLSGHTGGILSTTDTAAPHLFRNGIPYVDLAHVIISADPLVVRDENAAYIDDAVASSEARMLERDVMRRKEEDLYEAESANLLDPVLSSTYADTNTARRPQISPLESQRSSVHVPTGGGGVLSSSTTNGEGSVFNATSPSLDNQGGHRQVDGNTSSPVTVHPPQHPYFPHALDLTPLRPSSSRREGQEESSVNVEGEVNGNGEEEDVGGGGRSAASLPPIMSSHHHAHPYNDGVEVAPLATSPPFNRHPPPRPKVPNMEIETFDQQRNNMRRQGEVLNVQRAILDEQRQRDEEEASRVPITLQWHSSSQMSVPSPWTPAPTVKLDHEM